MALEIPAELRHCLAQWLKIGQKAMEINFEGNEIALVSFLSNFL